MVRLEITFDERTGQMKLDGAIDNLMVAYGLLEMAKDSVRMHHIQKAMSNRIAAPGLGDIAVVGQKKM